jgi:hypothetical protein
MVQKEIPTAEPRRRGRPRAYDPDTALAAAADVFWKKGYDGTSLDDLAAATGMNRPSLYAAFGDKHDLYLGGGPRGCFSIGTAATQAMVDPAVRAFLSDSIRGTDAFLGDLIGKARDRGEISRRSDPAVLAQIATAALHTLAVRARVGLSRKELDALASTAINTICDPAR